MGCRSPRAHWCLGGDADANGASTATTSCIDTCGAPNLGMLPGGRRWCSGQIGGLPDFPVRLSFEGGTALRTSL
jgi:hypothetical protein